MRSRRLSLLVASLTLSTLLACADNSETNDSDLACDHFRNVRADFAAGILSTSELRQKLKEVYDNASIATDGVRSAAQQMLAAVTQDAGLALLDAMVDMDEACTAAGATSDLHVDPLEPEGFSEPAQAEEVAEEIPGDPAANACAKFEALDAYGWGHSISDLHSRALEVQAAANGAGIEIQQAANGIVFAWGPENNGPKSAVIVEKAYSIMREACATY